MISRQKILAVAIPVLARRIQADPGFLKTFLTRAEIRYCLKNRYPTEPAAARLAAKKAFLFLMKTPAAEHRIWLNKIEIVKSRSGKPSLKIPSVLRKRLNLSKGEQLLVTLAHERELAIAWVACAGKSRR